MLHVHGRMYTARGGEAHADNDEGLSHATPMTILNGNTPSCNGIP